MKKKQKMIAIAAVLVVLIGAAAAFLLSNPPAEETGEEPPAGYEVRLMSDFQPKVSHVSVEHPSGDFAYDVTYNAEGKAERYIVEGYDDRFTFNGHYLQTVIDSASSLLPMRIVDEQPDDLSVYGLADPEVRIELTGDDGRTLTVSVGDEAPIGGCYYVIASSDPAVFIVDKETADNLLRALDDMRTDMIWDFRTISQIQTLRLDREKELGTSFEFRQMTDEEKDDRRSRDIVRPRVIFTDPEEIDGITDALEANLTNPMSFLESGRYIMEVYPEDISLYRLDQPVATVTVTTEEGYTYKVLFSGLYNNRLRFFMRDDLPVVYAASSSFTDFLEVNYVSLSSPGLFHESFDELESLTVTGPSAQVTMTVQSESGAGVSVAMLDGAAVDVAEARAAFELLSGISRAGETDGAVSAPEYRVAIRLKSGKTIEMAAQMINARQCAIRLDGKEIGYYCQVSSLETVLNALLKLKP